MRTEIAIVMAGSLVLGACSGGPDAPTQVVSAGAFRDVGPVPGGESANGGEDAIDEESAAGESDIGGTGEGERVSLAADPPAEVVVISSEQARGAVGAASLPRATPGTTVLIDAKVGDINGRAIYADDFLEELEARFTQEATRMPAGAWLRELEEAIVIKIRALLRQELLLAEALASLPEQQRTVGLAAALNRMQGRLESRNRGSAALARQRILEEMGMTVDEFLSRVQNDQLTRMILESRVEDRVNISWREIVQEYNRSIDVFNPEPEAHFRTIRVSADDTASVVEIARRFDAGDSFEEVASMETNQYRAGDGGLMDPTTIETTFEEVRVFKDDRLNEAAISLLPGEFAGPVETETSGGKWANWVYLERIREISVPLYDAQLAIADARETEQTEIELDRYYQRLLRGASVTDLDQMHARLMRIAVERFNPAALPMYLGAEARQ